MAPEPQGKSSGASVTISLRHNGVSKRIVVYPGISTGEVQNILSASFPNLPNSSSVVGVRDPRTKKVYSLEKLSKSPSFFSRMAFELRSEPTRKSNGAPNATRNPITDISTKEMKHDSLVASYARLFELRKADVMVIMQIFNSHAPTGVLDRSTFQDCFEEFLGMENQEYKVENSEENQTKLHAVLDRMFEMFDRDGNGTVDSKELLSGLSVLCQGDRDEKIEAAFALYDLNGDGEVTRDEMARYLTSVFSVINETTDEQSASNSPTKHLSPEERGRITAEQCFAEADLNGDGKLTFSEFKEWYSQSSGKGAARDGIGLPGALNWNPASVSLPNLEAVRRATGLNRFTPSEVFSAFKERATNGEMDRKTFRSCFRDLMTQKFGRTPEDTNKSMLDRLFGMFDRDGNGMVDFEELASGISVLCGGTRDDKIKAAFSLYDYNNDGYISLDEMKTYLTSVFRVLYDTSPDHQRLGVSAETLGAITAEQCFQEADVDNDGKLSFAEFRKWYSRPSIPSAAATSTSPSTTNALSADHENRIGSESMPHWLTLEEARRLTGLEHRTPGDVLDVFASFTDADGTLSKVGFRGAFQHIIAPHGPRSATDNKRTMHVLQSLFRAFDSDGNGKVDFGELVSGLTVLCGGTTQDKIEHAFELYDTDHDGYITMEEMEMYLTSVFRVLYETMPGVREQTKHSPEKLAALTTAECFQVADLNHDGLLSPAEFARWYVSDDGVALAGIEHAIPSWISMAEVRRVTGLGNAPVELVFEELALAANDEGLLSRTAFEQVFTRIAQQGEDPDRLRFVIPKLFTVFDADGNGMVDFSEIASGLSILCAGDTDTKAESAFALYDYNGDGYISQEEMTRYFSCVFRVMYEVEPATHARIGLPATELAQVTAKQVFAEADLNSDGRLSFEEFREWFSKSADAQIVEQSAVRGPQSIGIARIRQLTNMENYSPEDVFEVFAREASDDGTLNLASFSRAFNHVADRRMEYRSEGEKDELNMVVRRLFNLFDTNNDGNVDFSEISSGLSVLCGGNRDVKAEAAFALYDYNGDGMISLDEMTRYLTCVYKVMYELDPDSVQDIQVSPLQLADATARQIFVEADLNHDGRLGFDEFRRWYVQQDNIKAVEWHNPNREVVVPKLDLAAISHVTGLEFLTPTEVLNQFALVADADSMLDKDSFFRAFRDIFTRHQNTIDLNGEAQTALLDETLERLFDLFDQDGNGRVDFSELALGLSILCGGSRDEKVKAAFALYDIDGDGFISLDEMESYLTSVFRVLYKTQDGVADQMEGVTPDELAIITAEECFEEADRNKDGLLTFAEFKAWYEKPSDDTIEEESDEDERNDSAAGGDNNGTAGGDNIGTAGGDNIGTGLSTEPQSSDSSPGWVTLEEVRRLTQLNKFSPEDCFEEFALAANEDGVLTVDAFFSVFNRILEGSDELSADDYDRLDLVLKRLFAIFDTNNDGQVDFSELATGLTVLCNGDKDAKAQAAFTLYDYNCDGFISLDEMERYLCSVFKVMYETQPGVKERIGTSPEILASSTARQVFQDADVNSDGLLSFEEFQAWYQNPQQVGQSSVEQTTTRPTRKVATLKQIKQLTGLSRYTAASAFEEFALEADEEGVLNREAFYSVFRKLTEQNDTATSEEDSCMLNQLLEDLFTLFDSDNNGVVDFSELASGMSVLCGGDMNSKVEACFALYDFNCDGFIGLDEMVRYLTSIYKVVYVIDPSAQARAGNLTPEELAIVTSEEVFKSADVNLDGLLSFDEFKAWYSSGGMPTGSSELDHETSKRNSDVEATKKHTNMEATKKLTKHSSSELSLEHIRRITGLSKFSPEECFAEFAVAAADDGTLNRDSFFQVYESIVDRTGMSQEDREAAIVVGERLFGVFDQDSNGRVDFSELASGLSVLCGGSRDDKAEAAFSLYDTNGDGFISMEEMTRYLLAVFKVMYETQPEAVQRMGGVTQEELAHSTAQQVFDEADENNDGRLSFNEFKTWYSKPSGIAVNTVVEDAPSWVSLVEVRRLTGLDRFHASQCAGILAREAVNGELNRTQFFRAFRQISDPNMSQGDQDKLHMVLTRLFKILDTDMNGVVDYGELACGLSVLCGGDQNDKAKLAFTLFDRNRDGYISLNEMTQYLLSVFRVLKEAVPSAMKSIAVNLEALAKTTAERCFVDADLNQDGRLNFEEFQKWFCRPEKMSFLSQPSSSAAVAAAHTASAPPTGDDSTDESNVEDDLNSAEPDFGTFSLDEIRRLTKLEQYDVEDVLKFVFRSANDETEGLRSNKSNGLLDYQSFMSVFRLLVENAGGHTEPVDKENTYKVIHRLFLVFDEDRNGVVDAKELASGLSVLCAGTREDKVRSSFKLYDVNGDGFIELDEMSNYLSSVFKILYEAQPQMAQQMGVSPEELGAITAEQCFLEADLDSDGRLSFEEFKEWYAHQS